jgi:hypothetical protein
MSLPLFPKYLNLKATAEGVYSRLFVDGTTGDLVLSAAQAVNVPVPLLVYDKVSADIDVADRFATLATDIATAVTNATDGFTAVSAQFIDEINNRNAAITTAVNNATSTITTDYQNAIASEAQARDAAIVSESQAITSAYTTAISTSESDTAAAYTAAIASLSASSTAITDDHETRIAAIEAYITAQGGAP